MCVCVCVCVSLIDVVVYCFVVSNYVFGCIVLVCFLVKVNPCDVFSIYSVVIFLMC